MSDPIDWSRFSRPRRNNEKIVVTMASRETDRRRSGERHEVRGYTQSSQDTAVDETFVMQLIQECHTVHC